MLTRLASCQLRSLRCALPRAGKLGTPGSRSSRLGPRLLCLFFCPSTRTPAGHKENQPAGKMWKAPVLLLVLGSASLWLPAQGALTGLLEDDLVTPGAKDDSAIPGIEDSIVTTGTTGESYASAGPTALVPTSAESRTDIHIEDLPTPGGSAHTHKESHSTTAPGVATSRSIDKAAEETQTTVEKDGLATVTLVGIIVGVLLAIGFIGWIIFVVVRKMSGGYSP